MISITDTSKKAVDAKNGARGHAIVPGTGRNITGRRHETHA
jgi:hypothetical protein